MRNLISMNLYRLMKSRFFIGCIIFIFAFSMIVNIVIPIFTQSLATMAGQDLGMNGAVDFSSILSNPFVIFIPLIILISAVSFSYLDLSDGYIKNIAGHAKRKSDLVTAKYIAIMIHNLILMVVALLGFTLGTVIMKPIVFDAAIPAGIADFFIRWLLLDALCAILFFFSNGLHWKVPAIVAAVILGTGSLSLVYLGINSGLGALGAANFDIMEYAPSQLLSNASAVNGVLVANAVIVGAVVIALFFTLTVILFKKRDIR